jgi:hypothetical protein
MLVSIHYFIRINNPEDRFTIKKEAAWSSETLDSNHCFTRCNNPLSHPKMNSIFIILLCKCHTIILEVKQRVLTAEPRVPSHIGPRSERNESGTSVFLVFPCE